MKATEMNKNEKLNLKKEDKSGISRYDMYKCIMNQFTYKLCIEKLNSS